MINSSLLKRIYQNQNIQINNINDQNDQLKKANDILKQQNEQMKKDSDILKQQNEQMKKDSDILKQQNEQMKKDSDILKQQNEQMKKDSDILKQQNEQMKKDSDILKQQNDQLKKANDILKQQNEQMKKGYDILKPHIDKFYELIDYDEVPEEFFCPITNTIMKIPYLMEDGCTYEKEVIEKFLDKNDCLSPFTKNKISKVGTINEVLLYQILIFVITMKFQPINIFIRDLKDKNYCIQMRMNETVLELKKRIEKLCNIDVNLQRLEFGRRSLRNDNYTLEEYSIKNNDTIYVKVPL